VTRSAERARRHRSSAFRLREKDEIGTAPFLFLGPAGYVSHEGSKPISITWKLEHRLPLDWFHEAGILAS